MLKCARSQQHQGFFLSCANAETEDELVDRGTGHRDQLAMNLE